MISPRGGGEKSKPAGESTSPTDITTDGSESITSKDSGREDKRLELDVLGRGIVCGG